MALDGPGGPWTDLLNPCRKRAHVPELVPRRVTGTRLQASSFGFKTLAIHAGFYNTRALGICG